MQSRACGQRQATADSIGGSLAAGAAVARRSAASDSNGAIPSNTAPSNYIPDSPQLLHLGVDSLYLSFKGQLSQDSATVLDRLKKRAQSANVREKASAQFQIEDHCFEVLGRGMGKFAYVLVDNWFHIQISSLTSTTMPLAYVQVSSELLTHQPLVSVIQAARSIIQTFTDYIESVSISRADICVDFVSKYKPHTWDLISWVTRAKNIDQYSENHQLTGWTVGRGGDLMARLYDKTLECKKSQKEYFYPIWLDNGWNEKDTVWRLEFQFKKIVLSQLEITDIDLFDKKIATLWQYATVDWLRLTTPSKTDRLRSRWPNHPLWDFLSTISWNSLPEQVIKRVRKERIPSDDYLFTTGLGAITSFMAREKIEDFYLGIKAFADAAQRFHATTGKQNGKFLTHYINDKRLLKQRKYNTLLNPSIDLDDEGGSDE